MKLDFLRQIKVLNKHYKTYAETESQCGSERNVWHRSCRALQRMKSRSAAPHGRTHEPSQSHRGCTSRYPCSPTLFTHTHTHARTHEHITVFRCTSQISTMHYYRCQEGRQIILAFRLEKKLLNNCQRKILPIGLMSDGTVSLS